MSLVGEHPIMRHLTDWEECGADGIFEPNMALCFESFIGSKDGGEGVKPEEHVLLTETSADRLSIYGYDEDWCRPEPESQPRIPVWRWGWAWSVGSLGKLAAGGSLFGAGTLFSESVPEIA